MPPLEEAAPLLPDWLKTGFTICGGLAAWGLTLYFAKKWFEATVLEPIKKLGEDVETIRKGGEKVKTDALDFITSSSKMINDGTRTQVELFKRFMIETKKIVYDETTHMRAISDVAAKQAAEASEKIRVNDLGLKDLKSLTEKNAVNIQKLADVCSTVNDRGKAMQSEIVKIKTDLIMVKEKK